jgi:hypothetical protein
MLNEHTKSSLFDCLAGFPLELESFLVTESFSKRFSGAQLVLRIGITEVNTDSPYTGISIHPYSGGKRHFLIIYFVGNVSLKYMYKLELSNSLISEL